MAVDSKRSPISTKFRWLCSGLVSSNLATIVIILAGVLLVGYISNRTTLNSDDSKTYKFSQANPSKMAFQDDSGLSDPFKYLPPEEELKAAQKQHEMLRSAIIEERKIVDELSAELETELVGKSCVLKRKPVLSTTCAHIEEKGWREIGGVKTYFTTTECSDALKNGYPWVLFLHGAAFSVQTWVDLNMLRLTAKAGFNNLAIDLPGYGNSSKTASKVDPVEFLDAVLKEFKLDKVVVVSPSMSGGYSIRYLQKRKERFAGFVPVAPVSVDVLTNTDFETIDTPTLVIYGDKDTGLGMRSKEVLGKLKHSQIFEVKDAGHPCYRDQPKVFMVQFFKFLMCSIPKN